jgi:hypothetical protein
VFWKAQALSHSEHATDTLDAETRDARIRHGRNCYSPRSKIRQQPSES